MDSPVKSGANNSSFKNTIEVNSIIKLEYSKTIDNASGAT